ncbi:MAG: hypothetical protein IIU82_03530 [Tidjanibacter sp.]|nr:hypothetical protein [Tidjanibacter sp.]
MVQSAVAQQGAPATPKNVIYTERWMDMAQEQGRSYNFTPTFFIYPDSKLTEDGAKALIAELAMDSVIKENNATVYVLNPVGDKYDNKADFDAFVEMFNMVARSGNLKVIGIGSGATFVNSVLAMGEAASHIAGILTIGGKQAKAPAESYGVPAYVAGKGATKVAKSYIAINKAVAEGDLYANPEEPLLRVVVNEKADASLAEVFADAWVKVFRRNYRFNNYKHTQYEGAKFGQYGAYELEPYLIHEDLGVTREVVITEQRNGLPWLWYEYWPEGLKEKAAEKSVPVMVLLHGNTNDPRTQAETSGFIQVAAKERFFVVEMEWQGSRNYGAMGNDGVEQVLYQLFNKYPQLDPSRVYAEGLSAGSMTATNLGVRKSYLFTAVGGHSGGVMGNNASMWADATQKRGAVEVPYCSVLGTADMVVPFITPARWKGNGYLNAWNIYQQMNGMPVIDELDFEVDPIFGFELQDRKQIVTNKGGGLVVEMGTQYKGNVPMIQIIAVMDYGHWNFQPTAQMMWDFFKQYSRDPETKKLIYHGDK